MSINSLTFLQSKGGASLLAANTGQPPGLTSTRECNGSEAEGCGGEAVEAGTAPSRLLPGMLPCRAQPCWQEAKQPHGGAHVLLTSTVNGKSLWCPSLEHLSGHSARQKRGVFRQSAQTADSRASNSHPCFKPLGFGGLLYINR